MKIKIKHYLMVKKHKSYRVSVLNRDATDASRGWRENAPRSEKQRREVIARCGNSCFLNSTELKYPICQKIEIGRKNRCVPDCKGILAAKIRSSQYHINDIKDRANYIGNLLKCKWTKRQTRKKYPKNI